MSLSRAVIDAFLRKVHAGFNTMSAIEQGIWREVLAAVNEATVNGLLKSSAPTFSEAFLSALRHSNEVFAAFKVHTLQQEVAAKLLTPDGKLKSFADFRRDVEGITSHQCGAWLRTEYDTAVIRAHNAADWQQFEANKDVMPNLRWLPTTAPDPEQNHRAFWTVRLNLPVSDPFWQHHHPGDHWNCKCSLEQNDDPVVRPSDIPSYTAPDRGLENNPGTDAHTFSDNHPYFPDKCSHCFAYKSGKPKNRLTAVFRNARAKDCYNCKYIDGCIDRAKAKKAISDAAFEKKKEIKENNLMPASEKTEYSNLMSGVLNRTGKVRNTFLKHCHHDYDVEAAKFIWNNPENMEFEESEELGKGKDMSLQKNKDNIKKKKEVLHFVLFNRYSFKFGKREFYVKLALCKKGYEQFYSLVEK